MNKEMLERLKARDLIALVALIGLITFKMTGHNGSLDIPMALIIGYYFGRRNDIVEAANKRER